MGLVDRSVLVIVYPIVSGHWGHCVWSQSIMVSLLVADCGRVVAGTPQAVPVVVYVGRARSAARRTAPESCRARPACCGRAKILVGVSLGRASANTHRSTPTLVLTSAPDRRTITAGTRPSRKGSGGCPMVDNVTLPITLTLNLTLKPSLHPLHRPNSIANICISTPTPRPNPSPERRTAAAGTRRVRGGGRRGGCRSRSLRGRRQ